MAGPQRVDGVDNFTPGKLTLCSPDPQAIRPPGEKINFLLVTLPTNFKSAAFESAADTQILRNLQADVDAIKYDPGDGEEDRSAGEAQGARPRSSCRSPSGRCC